MSYAPIAVPWTSWDALVWLWKSTIATPGSAPISFTIGRWEMRPPAMKRPSATSDTISARTSSRELNRRRRMASVTRVPR